MSRLKQDAKPQAAFLGSAVLLLVVTLLFAPHCLQGPYIQSPTTNSAVIRWRTTSWRPIPCTLRYRADTAAATEPWSERISVPTGDAHEVILTNLLPGMRYQYSIHAQYRRIAGGEDFAFVTAPMTGIARSIRVWVLGDSGTGNDRARAVRDGFRQYVGSRPADLILMLGDNAYENGSRFDHHKAVFLPYREFLRNTPLWPALGNHDVMSHGTIPGTYRFHEFFTLPQRGECGGVPSENESYYSFDWANVHFVCLDSTVARITDSTDMVAWLKMDLEASRSQDWLIAFWHHPPYSSGHHDSDTEPESSFIRSVAIRELEKYDVDLVLCGHNHSYGRTHLLRGHYGESSTFESRLHEVSRPTLATSVYRKLRGREAGNGTMYIVAGCSGKLEEKPLDHDAMAVKLNVAGSVVLDVDDNKLDFHFVDESGVSRDSFRILK